MPSAWPGCLPGIRSDNLCSFGISLLLLNLSTSKWDEHGLSVFMVMLSSPGVAAGSPVKVSHLQRE